MKYYSLQNKSPWVHFREAAIAGQAPDGGLYFPEVIPELSKGFVNSIEQLTNEEIAFEVMRPYVVDAIPNSVLADIIQETVHFPVPLVQVDKDIFSLELFHGRTLAFKDIGARFMSRCLGYFVKDSNKKLTVLVATSGDTGGAVADGFYGVEGVQVVILYPSGKVSSVQEKQLTALGNNIHAIEINGTFDDCQRLVKKAFADKVLKDAIFLTSANSINVARWLPQQFFYFFAYKQWQDKNNPPVISIPSGNFGNICAGILAMKSGLPIKHFLAACNANDVVPKYFQTNQYIPQQSVSTISNAMDVGDPSNFIRILNMFPSDLHGLKENLSSVSISDQETTAAIKRVYVEEKYLLDPHGAVGYVALKNYLSNHPNQQGIFAETAHPVKFYDVVEPIIGTTIPIPSSLVPLLSKEKISHKMDVDYLSLVDYLISIY